MKMDWISFIIGMWVGAGILTLGIFSKDIKNIVFR